MFKQVSFYRRNDGITHQEFCEYYENTHVKTRLSSMRLPGLRHYLRRYLTPIPDPITDRVSDSGYDVITELWFDTKADWENYRKVSQDVEVREIATRDEILFMDQSSKCTNLIEEYELIFSSEGPVY